MIRAMIETPHWGVSTKTPNWKHGTLGVVIDQYKPACTKKIRTEGYTNFDWQAGAQDVGIEEKCLPYCCQKY